MVLFVLLGEVAVYGLGEVDQHKGGYAVGVFEEEDPQEEEDDDRNGFAVPVEKEVVEIVHYQLCEEHKNQVRLQLFLAHVLVLRLALDVVKLRLKVQDHRADNVVRHQNVLLSQLLLPVQDEQRKAEQGDDDRVCNHPFELVVDQHVHVPDEQDYLRNEDRVRVFDVRALFGCNLVKFALQALVAKVKRELSDDLGFDHLLGIAAEFTQPLQAGHFCVCLRWEPVGSSGDQSVFAWCGIAVCSLLHRVDLIINFFFRGNNCALF